MKLFRRLLLLTLYSALTGAAWVAHRPAQWEVLQPADSGRKAPLGVLDQMSQAAIKRSAPFEISEARLNEHLAGRVSIRQRLPLLEKWVRFEGPFIALEEGSAQVRMRWLVAEHHFSDITVNLIVHREADAFQVEVRDGAYGRLRVPRGLLVPVKPGLEALADALAPEIEALFQMNQIRIQKHKLLLDPRYDVETAER